MATLFHQIRWGDSLLRIEAPFINPILLPFIVLGFLYTLWNWRRWNVLFTVIWFAVFALPIPLLGAPWPRVIYPALMPMMLWGRARRVAHLQRRSQLLYASRSKSRADSL